MPRRSSLPDPAVVRFLATRPPRTLCRVIHRSWIWWYFDQRPLARLKGNNPSAHYDEVISRLHLIAYRDRRSPTPWRDANLIWMAVTTFDRREGAPKHAYPLEIPLPSHDGRY